MVKVDFFSLKSLDSRQEKII